MNIGIVDVLGPRSFVRSPGYATTVSRQSRHYRPIPLLLLSQVTISLSRSTRPFKRRRLVVLHGALRVDERTARAGAAFATKEAAATRAARRVLAAGAEDGKVKDGRDCQTRGGGPHEAKGLVAKGRCLVVAVEVVAANDEARSVTR